MGPVDRAGDAELSCFAGCFHEDLAVELLDGLATRPNI